MGTKYTEKIRAYRELYPHLYGEELLEAIERLISLLT